MTDEQAEEAKIQAELSQDNHDVPNEVVPKKFQGKTLYKVVMALKGKSYAGFSAPEMCFHLYPNGEITNAYIRKDGETTYLQSAKWKGQSSGSGTEAISAIYIEGQSKDGQDFAADISEINIASKSVNAQQTVYAGTASGVLCTLGEHIWLNDASGGTSCRMTYYLTGGN